MDHTNFWVEYDTYWEHTAPQKDPAWHEIRIGRTTGSNSGTAAGHSKFKTPEKLAREIAGLDTAEFSDHSMDIMNHGVVTEPEARDWYARQHNLKIVERGCMVPKWDFHLGASIDGDVFTLEGKPTDTIVEIKCPMKMYAPLKKYMERVNSGWKPPLGYKDHIWSTHYDQMMQCMAIPNKKKCVYIVYCKPEGSVFTQVIDFNPDYWNNILYPKLTQFKTQLLLPLLNSVDNVIRRYPILPPN